MNAAPPTDAQAHLEYLSALADGRPESLDQACKAWAQSASAKAAWHRWHLIGDAMRSDELAVRPERDEAFLLRLRERLAQEPVVFAPAALAPGRASAPEGGSGEAGRDARQGFEASVAAFGGAGRRPALRRWAPPAAVAAGFAAVAVAAFVVRGPVTQSAPEFAQSLPGSATQNPTANSATANNAALPLMVVNEQMIRDTQLDRYLQAHRQGAGAMPAATPGNPTRRIETVSLSR